MRLVAIKQPYLRYNTRRLLPGEEFEARPGYGRIMKKLGRAMDAPVPGKAATAKPQPAPASPPADDNDLDALRTRAIALGLTIDQRWGIKRLQSAIKRATGAMV